MMISLKEALEFRDLCIVTILTNLQTIRMYVHAHRICFFVNGHIGSDDTHIIGSETINKENDLICVVQRVHNN